MSEKADQMREQIDELAEQRCWPPDLVSEARFALLEEDFERLDRVLARLDRLPPAPTSVDELVEGEFDRRTQTNVVRLIGDWLVTWSSYGFNDRLFLQHRDEWPWVYTAGWCYEKGGTVILAAKAFDPPNDWAPAGFKKTACDSRACNRRVDEGPDHLHLCFCTAPAGHPEGQHRCDHGPRR